MRAATPGRVLCRINGFGPWTAGEVADAVAAGADEILLPMVRSTDRWTARSTWSAGRCGLGILIETQDAVDPPPSLPPAAHPHLRRAQRSAHRPPVTELFRPLVDGTVEAVRAVVAQPFGVAGLTLPGGGFPVSSDLLAAELVRTGAEFRFLRRAFTADMAGRDPFVEVPRLLDSLARLRRADPASVAASGPRSWPP